MNNNIEFQDDFNRLDTALWGLLGGGGSNHLLDGRGGWLGIATGADVNDYYMLASNQKCFDLSQPLQWEARIKVQESNHGQNSAAFVVGLADVEGDQTWPGDLPFAGTSRQAIPNVFDGFLFAKDANSNRIYFGSSLGSQQSLTQIGTFQDGVPIVAGFRYTPATATGLGSVSAYMSVNGANPSTVQQSFPIGSNTAGLFLILGVKAESSAAETLQVDYVQASQPR